MQGVDDQLGTVSVGKLADIIVVNGDPLQDIRVLQHGIVHVIKDGKVYK
jgi:imidazolonepropionase-like amidohydrolase